ncbi:complement component C1q receptor-like [Parambassis ranga]|uniref:Complement component C1q receptor-like n=1 Tax=Parambassis ranga TaxID=210632 RepID=A0A6P7HD07_9TELE|nr:complement component C1q receptor-like [Parambassis ranga]
MSSPQGAGLTKMQVRPCCCWTFTWFVLFLLRNVSAQVSSMPRYTLHRTNATFAEAVQSCSPGVLTTIATEQEVSEILKLVSNPAPLQGESTFWVGLKKEKHTCVLPLKPLRGFTWTENGHQESQVSRWAEEPTPTCTAVRCAALKVQFDGAMVPRWGLIPVLCRRRYQFICKQKNEQMETLPEDGQTIKPATPEPEQATPESTPVLFEPSEPAAPEIRPTTSEPRPAAPEPELEPNPSDSCQHPSIPSVRSLTLDPDNSSQIRVECWSPIWLDLFCSGHPATWRMLDGSLANISTICQQCEAGFQKDASGHCVDIDECSGAGGASCRHTCLNTPGSYRCVCYNDTLCEDTATARPDEASLSAILIPVVVAVAALVVLVLVVAVTVKCCLMRRSKRRAVETAERVALKSKDSKDSCETANERAT